MRVESLGFRQGTAQLTCLPKHASRQFTGWGKGREPWEAGRAANAVDCVMARALRGGLERSHLVLERKYQARSLPQQPSGALLAMTDGVGRPSVRPLAASLLTCQPHPWESVQQPARPVPGVGRRLAVLTAVIARRTRQRRLEPGMKGVWSGHRSRSSRTSAATSTFANSDAGTVGRAIKSPPFVLTNLGGLTTASMRRPTSSRTTLIVVPGFNPNR